MNEIKLFRCVMWQNYSSQDQDQILFVSAKLRSDMFDDVCAWLRDLLLSWWLTVCMCGVWFRRMLTSLLLSLCLRLKQRRWTHQMIRMMNYLWNQRRSYVSTCHHLNHFVIVTNCWTNLIDWELVYRWLYVWQAAKPRVSNMSSAKKTEAQQLNNKHQVSMLPHLCGITYWNLYDLPLLQRVLTTVEDWFSVRMFLTHFQLVWSWPIRSMLITLRWRYNKLDQSHELWLLYCTLTSKLLTCTTLMELRVDVDISFMFSCCWYDSRDSRSLYVSHIYTSLLQTTLTCYCVNNVVLLSGSVVVKCLLL